MKFSQLNPLIIASNLINAVLGRSIAQEQKQISLDERRRLYSHLWACYNNAQYDRLLFKGSLDYVNEALGEAAANDLAGIFNPFERVCELYAQNCFAGRFGEQIEVAPEVGTKRKRRAVHPDILDPLEQIFEWSNLNIESKVFGRWGSIFGSVGIRVVAQVGKDYPADRREDRRVYLQFEHPGSILGAVQDDRGNVTQALTEHEKLEGNLSIEEGDRDLERYTYRTLLTKDTFAVVRQGGWLFSSFTPFDQIRGAERGSFSRFPNLLRVCPYVIAHHKRIGGLWGLWAFHGQMQKVDRLNALIAHINRQIFRHVNVVHLISGSGRAPRMFDFSGNKVLYQRKRPDDTSKLDIHQLVTDLSLADAITQAKFILGELRDSMPELKATDGEYLSNQSGETVAQLRLPAEQRILSARDLYEDALLRALKMALSWGIMLGIFKIGGVSFDRDGAERAFRSGMLDFRFNERDALPITATERLEREQKEQDLLDAREERRLLTEGGGSEDEGRSRRATGAAGDAGASGGGAPEAFGREGELEERD